MPAEKKSEVDIKIKKSLAYSILNGAFYSAMVGFGESFFSAFAVFLKATNIQIGLLGSLPQALGSLSQLYTNKLIHLFKSRKRVVCTFALFEALMYIPIALVFFFGTLKVYHLILFVCLYWIFGAILMPAWNSWMGDLVDEKERGAYFGRRNKVAGLVSFISFLTAGYILQGFSDGTLRTYVGFATIFTFALMSRIISLIYMTKKYEPRYHVPKEAEFSFIDFLKQARFRNYGLFVIYLSLMNFSVYIAGPFFTPYMLYELKFNYQTFTIVSAVALIVKFLMMPVWGSLSDKYGTKKVLTVSGFLMPVVPLLWIFSTNVWYLILIQAYSGLVWAGFELSTFNFVFDTTTPQKRATCVAYYNVLNGTAILLGALIGGFIVRYNSIFWSNYIILFILSTVLRYAVSLLFLSKLREVRTVETISYTRLLTKVFATLPTSGLLNHHLITFRRK